MQAPQVQNGSVESAAPKHRRRESTPKSMEAPSNKAAISSPKEIDYFAIVKAIMLIKGSAGNGYGDRMVSNKGRQHVFALACAQVCSMLGAEDLVKFTTPDGVERFRLPEVLANKVKDAIGEVLDSQWNRFKTYGGSVDTSDIRWTWDKPKFSVIGADKSGLKDAEGKGLRDMDLRWKATAIATRASKDLGEQSLCAEQVLKAAEKRLENMDKKPNEYTREQKRDVMDLIHLAKWKVGHIERVKAQNERKLAALKALSDDLTAGKVSPEQYAEAKAAIENEPVVS